MSDKTGRKRLVTVAKLAANQANAKLSTGPRTEEGKAIAAANAETHGLLADAVRIGAFPAETEEAYEAFGGGLTAELAPVGALEGMLAERVVSAAWRLRRAARLEGHLTNEAVEAIQENRQTGMMLHDRGAGSDLSQAVSHLFRRGCYEQLTTYENRIRRDMYKALYELHRTQRRRDGQDVPPPALVQVELC